MATSFAVNPSAKMRNVNLEGASKIVRSRSLAPRVRTANRLVPVGVSEDDVRRIAALRAGDEEAFSAMVNQHHSALLRLARSIVHDTAVAEEVVQETWLGLLEGLGRFEGRSSLKTWLYTILVNRARTRVQREARYVPFSSFGDSSDTGADTPVELAHFLDSVHPATPGAWSLPSGSRSESPEKSLLSRELRQRLEDAIAALPPTQRKVITLRDVLGWTSEEVCNTLGISETNGRVLLHRGRTQVRSAIDRYLGANGDRSGSETHELRRDARTRNRVSGRSAQRFAEEAC